MMAAFMGRLVGRARQAAKGDAAGLQDVVRSDDRWRRSMDDVAILPARHKLDVHTYHRMAEAGILGEDDRIELLDGEPPGPADVLLLVEVADSSLRFDETVKVPLYARAGIAELWVVDVKRNVVHTYRGPAGDGYRERVTRQPGERLALALAPEIVVTLDLLAV
jgi:hypothetical protein